MAGSLGIMRRGEAAANTAVASPMRVGPKRAGSPMTVAAVLTALVLAGGCAETSEPRGYSKPISVGVATASSATTPVGAADPTASYVTSNLFTGLTVFAGTNGRPGRGVASKIETADQITWAVTLAKGWTFQDGTPVTSTSFVDAWNYAANPQNNTANRDAFANIAGFAELSDPAIGSTGLPGLQVIDEQQFTITLNTPDSQLQTALATPAFAPLPAAFFDDPAGFAANPVGNGPFTWAGSSDDGTIVLERYEDYRARKPLVTEVTLRPSNGPEAAAEALEGGAIDAYVEQTTRAIPGAEDASSDASNADRTSGRQSTTAASGTLEFLAFPLYEPRFASPDVRAALSIAIDRQQILAQLPEFGVEPATSWAAPVANGYVATGCGTNCTYNAEQALNELEDGGGFDGPLVISYPEGSSAPVWLPTLCSSITNTLGVECTGQSLPPDQFDAAVAARQMPGPFLQSISVPAVPSLEQYLGPSYLPSGPRNVTGFNNDVFGFSMAAGLAQPQAEGMKSFQAAQKELGVQMPSVPLWFPRSVVWHDTDVRNVSLTPFSQLDLMKVSRG